MTDAPDVHYESKTVVRWEVWCDCGRVKEFSDSVAAREWGWAHKVNHGREEEEDATA